MSGEDKRSEFDLMDTETLMNFLRTDVQQPEGEELDADTMLYISKLIAERNRNNAQKSTHDANEAWVEFNEKYRPFCSDSHTFYEDDEGSKDDVAFSKTSQQNRPRKRMLWWKLVAAVICVFAVGIGTAYAAGYDILGAIARWTSETFQFVNLSPNDNITPSERSTEYLTLEDALETYNISPEGLIPTWVPDRFNLTSIQVDETPLMIMFQSYYECDSGFFQISITYFQEIIADVYEKDAIDAKIYKVGNVDHYLFSNNGTAVAVWAHGNCNCSVSGDISMSELKEIVDSVY